MPRKPRLRQCMRCGHINPGREKECQDCHAPLVKKRFAMTHARIKQVHTIAMRQKGLSYDDYKIILKSIGIESSADMKEKHYNEFMRRMNKLPDARRAA